MQCPPPQTPPTPRCQPLRQPTHVRSRGLPPQRLNYAERLQAGQAIGSGQVEGQAKTLGLRLKGRGARWNRGNVQAMASLVCVRHTCQWETYWTMAI